MLSLNVFLLLPQYQVCRIREQLITEIHKGTKQNEYTINIINQSILQSTNAILVMSMCEWLDSNGFQAGFAQYNVASNDQGPLERGVL